MLEESFSHWAIQICQNQGSTSSPIFRENAINFRNILAGFSSLAAFLGTTPAYLKKWVRLFDAEFNAESIGINFKSQKWKSKKLVCSFLIALFHFDTNLTKWNFFLFYRPFWTVVKFLPSRSEAEKIAVSDKKNTFTYQTCFRGTFLLYTDKIYIKKSCNYSVKTNFLIYLSFWGRNMLQTKEQPFW